MANSIVPLPHLWGGGQTSIWVDIITWFRGPWAKVWSEGLQYKEMTLSNVIVKIGMISRWLMVGGPLGGRGMVIRDGPIPHFCWYADIDLCRYADIADTDTVGMTTFSAFQQAIVCQNRTSGSWDIAENVHASPITRLLEFSEHVMSRSQLGPNSGSALWLDLLVLMTNIECR